jgi:hypothetical protein
MFVVSGEMKVPREEARVMNLFCHGVKTEYGLSLALVAVFLRALLG